jgi:hypothetical protein
VRECRRDEDERSKPGSHREGEWRRFEDELSQSYSDREKGLRLGEDEHLLHTVEKRLRYDLRSHQDGRIGPELRQQPINPFSSRAEFIPGSGAVQCHES